MPAYLGPRPLLLPAGLGLLLAAAVLTGCGTARATAPPGGPTPADQLADAAVTSGQFTLLPTRPPGVDDAAGTAWLARSAGGTTITVRMSGLHPGGSYMAHLHAQHCGLDAGGPHFQFDPHGPPNPPNEIWLPFTAGPDGDADATTTNPRAAGPGARAVVVHPAEAMDNRLACADF